MENLVRTIEEPGICSVDVSAIGRRDTRRDLLNSIQKLGYRCRSFQGFWKYSTKKSRAIPKRLLILGDLSNIVKQYKSQGRHRWVASVRDNKPYFLALIRTKLDEHYVDFVDDLVRHSDMRVTVCRTIEKDLWRCLIKAMSALQPDSLIDVRYSTATNRLWVQFGDGVSGFVDWKQLGLENEVKDLLLETATVGDRAESVEIVRRDRGLFEVDADSIKATLDETFAQVLASEAKNSDQKVGQRMRLARESAGLTQQELSDKTGIDQAIISKLERGSHQPRVDTLERVAKGLEISLTELLTTRANI